MKTSARKNNTNMLPPRGPERNNTERTEDTEMGSASKYLRGPPEPFVGKESKGELRA